MDTTIAIGYLAFLLRALVNIGLMVYFAFTQSWIAIGIHGTFGILSILALVAGMVITTVVCFSYMGSGY